MADAPAKTRKTAHPKTRADDARGTPPGQGTITPAHGGRIGNPRFVPTEAQRARVRQLAQGFPLQGEHFIARLIGVGRTTLREYFAEDIETGRAEMLARIGGQMIMRAMDAAAVDQEGKPIAKGDLDAQKFVLARLGGWTTKVDLNTPDRGGGGDSAPVDLSQFSEADLQEYGRLAAIAEGLDPDEVAGPEEG